MREGEEEAWRKEERRRKEHAEGKEGGRTHRDEQWASWRLGKALGEPRKVLTPKESAQNKGRQKRKVPGTLQ